MHPPVLAALAELVTTTGITLWLVWHDIDPPTAWPAGEVWPWPHAVAALHGQPVPDRCRLRSVDTIHRATVTEARHEARLWRVAPPRQRRFTQAGCALGALLQRLTIDAATDAELDVRLAAARAGFAAEHLTLVVPAEGAALGVLGPRINAYVVTRIRRLGCPTGAAALLLALATDAWPGAWACAHRSGPNRTSGTTSC